MPSTRQQIQSLINQIFTGANYTANALNGLLTNMLDSVFSPFYSAAAKPNSSNNQTQGFKAGSIGMDTSNARVYACSSSTDSSATWDQITQDRNVSTIVATTGSSYTLGNSDAYIIYSGSQDGVTVNLPIASDSYLGKIIKVYFSGVTTSGAGVSFIVPEPIGGVYTAVAANVYPDDSMIDLIFNGSTWAGYNSSSVTPTLESAYNAGNLVGQFEVILSDSPSSNVSMTNAAYTGDENVIFGTGAGSSSAGNENVILGKIAGSGNTGNSNVFIGNGAGFLNNAGGGVFLGINSGVNNAGTNVVAIGTAAGDGNWGSNCVILGPLAGMNNSLANSFIIGNTSLPEYASYAAASAALGSGSSGNTYLYYNSTNNAIEGVRIP